MKLNVALLIFNRPDLTRVVFEVIRKAKPDCLLVVADGARSDKVGEAEKCAAVRKVIDDGIDWPCEVRKNYSESNLGCRLRVSSGLSWVFEQVEHCIVLEDDCLPDPTFFPFCQTLLEEYSDDPRIMAISGDNFQIQRRRTGYSYSFSDIVHVWGWATWRRAWQKYDVELSLWPEIKRGNWLKDLLGNEEQKQYWSSCFDACIEGLDTWDYQWLFACWVNRGLCILPSCNLISNIGFQPDATHTVKLDNKVASLATQPMQFPLIAPPFMIRDREAHDHTFSRLLRPSKMQKLRQFLAKSALLRKLVRRSRAIKRHGK
jgi:hypothetical protein